MIYEKYDKLWKVWMLVPFALLLASMILIVSTSLSTGFFIGRDVELSGGNRITMEIEKPVDILELRAALPYASFKVTSGMSNELLIETSPEISAEKVLEDLADIGISGNYNIKTVGPVLGEIFWRQALLAMILAFILMSIVVFILFRSAVPSFIVIFSVIANFIITVGIMNVVGINLSLPVIAALLMVIGYSVDTDILLTSEVLKSGAAEISSNIRSTIKTGLTMSITTLAALLVLYLVSGSFVLSQIALVLMIGISVDIMITWFGNSGMIRLWVLRHEKVA